MSEGGTKAGSMIFELDLDRTRYDKGLQDALTSAEEKGVSIDKAWKNLGTKSDEMFTRMKANAILSYETIAKSATASAEDQARAAAMGAAKIEALNAKQFATQIAQTKAMQAAQQQYWDNLGIRSQATIQRQIDETTKGAAILQSTLKKNSQDWINIERAKNDSLAHLHDEMVGKQEWSMAAMARASRRGSLHMHRSTALHCCSSNDNRRPTEHDRQPATNYNRQATDRLCFRSRERTNLRTTRAQSPVPRRASRAICASTHPTKHDDLRSAFRNPGSKSFSARRWRRAADLPVPSRLEFRCCELL